MPIRVVAFLAGPSSQRLSLTTFHSYALLPCSSPVSATTSLSFLNLSESSLRAQMATPSSSATSPSPPMPYLHHAPPPQQASLSSEPDSVEEQQRKKAVKKFLARAEIAMVTRSLRARLAYASYKATHNVPHVPIRDLEAQSQSQTASFNRTVAAKRKAVGAAPTYYHTPATLGPSTTSGAGSQRRGGSGSMAPPASVTSPRLNQPSIPGTPSHPSFHEPTFSVRNHPPSLYSSILAPPPAKQARTIHNVHDPPLSAPSRPEPSPKTRVQKTSPRSETSRAKGKQTAKPHKPSTSPGKRRTQGGSIDKGKRKQDTGVDEDGDVDMKAAAALTSLLMHNRPSIAGSASSPRSSIDGSEAGSVYSYSHFAQSSARTSAVNVPTPLSAAPSSSNGLAEPGNRIQTPPPSAHIQPQQTTPRAAPTDSEAANLMLFLATSPSPARPANKDAKDMAAYRALGGGTGPLRSKGRVLFPSSTAADTGPSGQENITALPAGTSYRSPALTRGGDASFASSISSIGDLGGSSEPSASGISDGHGPQSQGSVPSGSSSGPVVAQLLPPAPLPLPPAPPSPTGRMDTNVNPRPLPVGASSGNNSTLDFNFHEFINASPSSPSRTAHGLGTAGNHKSNLGLRADVGRKLFEEEQMRHAHALQGATGAAGGGPGQRPEDRALGAGIDLVHT